ncbi:MAG: glycoside hydrolase family 2 TIM barrel-domain containing protein [Anaerolineae bacterium]|jgi:beta-mannosidase
MSRKVLDLGGDGWQLGQAPASGQPGRATWGELEQITEWLPATVPGNIRADLVRAGHLPDLYYGAQAETSQWVDEHCWWLVRKLPIRPSPTHRVHLVLRGVDYIGDIFVNGHHLGRHEGMFSPQVYDVTTLLGDENRLAVRILGSQWLPARRSGPRERFWNYVESRTASTGGRFPQRRDTLKCQMGFGWDFSPPLRTMGIWDDVQAIVTGDAFIRDVALVQRLVGDDAQVTVEIEVDAASRRAAEIRCTLAGETFEGPPSVCRQPVELFPGVNRHNLELTLSQPRLWWPWDQGCPDLYRLTVEISEGGQPLDSLTRAFGLRQVELDGWTLRINGRRVYARGANWVPANILPGRVDEADYRALLMLARGANMNMLRVWGGGLREKQAFYDLCDRLGILVWQEFPLACAFLTRFPRSPDYLRLLEDEARAIVRDLRSHSSLVLWCGGNEFSPQRNAPVVATLQRVICQEDPDRPFLPASPAGGDSHNWKVWHNFHPPVAYRDDPALFASEFGLQAPPDAEALEQFIPPDELWPPGPSWAYHGADLQKLRRYAEPFTQGQEPDLLAFVQASQRAQGHALQIAVEYHRRRKVHGGGGVLIWQLNEPWPAISWALVAHACQPKPAFEKVRQLFTPLLISLDYPLRRYQAGDEFTCDLWIINDRHEALEGCEVVVVLWDGAGVPAERFSLAVDVAADSAGQVASICWSLPPGRKWRLSCELHHRGQTLSTNEYELGIHDDIQPTLGQRVWAWLSGLAVPS